MTKVKINAPHWGEAEYTIEGFDKPVKDGDVIELDIPVSEVKVNPLLERVEDSGKHETKNEVK
jgi:hypothetical protein